MPQQSIPNLHDLVRVLSAATDNNSLHWTKTADENAFRAEFGVGMVRISRVPDATLIYVLTLLDNDGSLLEEYRPTGEGDLNEMQHLYQRARHQALNLDHKLKGVYDWLKQLAGESK
jgi:hypothetical protein